MAIVVDGDYSDRTGQSFNLTKDWLIGETILLNTDCNSIGRIFDLNEKQTDEEKVDRCRSEQVERLHILSQQVIEKPNRTCLSDAYDTIDFPIRTAKKALRSIIPSQSTLFELSQHKPDRNRWILTFPEDEEVSSDDDGFQSASSTVSEDKSKLVSVLDDPTDLWSRALVQIENKFLTWEQRGSYIYDRTRPFLFDFPLDDRAFQHICLLLLFHKPSLSIDINYRPIAVEEFLRDLCYMLMGIPSQTFEWNEIHQTFELKHDVYILGYTPITIERFSIKYIQAGNRFYLIKQYINQSSKRSETESEFCQALRYYLRYIQKAIALPDLTQCSLIKFAAQLDSILCSLDLPLTLLATITDLEKSIRTSSPQTSAAFIKLSSILHSLLNHTLHSIDHNYFLLSVHFLTYTLRPLLSFLTSLIIHSTYLDRYNEYPILFHSNRLTGLKSTDFWTKTLTIRYLHANDTDTIFHQILPIEHLQQIVNITRSLMLIKLCDKNHPLSLITTQIIPKLTFNSVDRTEISAYEREMTEKIAEYEQAQKQKRLDIEQMKVQERMDMYARQDRQRAERQKIAADANEQTLKAKQTLRDQWQAQVDKKQKQVKEDKLAETMADAEFNRVTPTTTIIGSRLGTSYDALVQNVRDEIIAEYDAKMRNATEREEQSRQRIQPTTNTNTPREVQPSLSTVSSASTLSFHTPAVDQSPIIDDKATVISSPSPRKTTNDLLTVTPKEEVVVPTMTKLVHRQTATEQTTEPEYRRTVKHVPSNVLKSTIQNYMMDHHPLDDSQDEEDLPEKVYDWETIINNGPQFQYEDSFDFSTEEKSPHQQQAVQSWSDFDMSPLRVWLERSISPLIDVQSQLVNRALLNYFFDELKLLYHLKNLRAYYFLATGRFGLAFCSELSRLLLNNDDVQVIYRVTSMRQILYTSLDQTGELSHLIDLLQLTSKMNVPNTLSLLDSNLLDYFELNYAIQWPLNIVISQEMLGKYQIIFRFLLRILVVKQILNEIWVMLKACKQQNATLSSLHQYRHQMQHFLTVFINYITNQVIQIAWNEFIRKIQQAKHINEIAAAHHEYLDRTMLNCLLTPNAAPILNEVNRVLTLIIRFRCQLKTFSWILSATYTDVSDTSVQALRTTFEKYHIAVLSLYKVLSKLVEKGYKTSLADLLIRLNHNGYYDRIATSSIRRS